MFENNNKRVVLLLAGEHYRKNRLRNLVCITAIALTSLMLITVFSIGHILITEMFETEQDYTSDLTGIIVLIVLSVLTIAICAYALVYNTFCISVTSNVRYYGLIRSVGITREQIKGILFLEGIRMLVPGLLFGVVCGYFFSSAIVPAFLMKLLGGEEYLFECDYRIIIGTVLFTIFTVMIAMRKPAVLAGMSSPVEAQRYRAGRGKKRKQKPVSLSNGKKQGFSWFRFALRNIRNDGKKFFFVLIPMSLGIIICLLIESTVSGLNVDRFIELNTNAQIEIENVSLLNGKAEEKHVITEDLVEAVKSIDGVEYIRPMRVQLVITEDGYEEAEGLGPEQLFSHIIETDFSPEYIETRPDIDWDAFDDGTICLIPEEDHPVVEPGMTVILQEADFNEKNYSADGLGVYTTVGLGGSVEEKYGNAGAIRTIPPHYLVSGKFLDRLGWEGIISRIRIYTESDKEEYVNDIIKKILNGYEHGDDISIVSSMELREELNETKKIMYNLGGCLAVMIAIIGTVNFMNYFYSGIEKRRYDFTVMESIGVRKKQIVHLVIYEGILYYIAIMFTALTVGNLVLLGAYIYLEHIIDYADFSYPWKLLLGIALVMLLVCFIIPRITIYRHSKESVVERLKFGE